jgi:hypothetical protein
MPVPSGQQSWTYDPVVLPKTSIDPSQTQSTGVGPIAQGGDTVNISVALNEFSGSVNVYFGIHAPSVDPDIYILNSNYGLQSSSKGIAPWKENITGPVNETLFTNIPISVLPSGTYYLYLAVTPAGSMSTFYLWTTYFVVP